MIAAINMQWLGIGIAALVVVALLIVVLIRHRGEDEPAMTAAPQTFAVSEPRAGVPSGPRADAPSGPPPGWAGPAAAPLETTPQAPATSPAAASQAPLTPPVPVVATPPPLSAAPAGSFLDEPLVRGFEGLGRVAAPAKPVSSGPFPVDPFGSHEDIFPAEAPVVAPDAEAPVVAPVDPFGSHEDIFPAEAPVVAPNAASAVAKPVPAAEPEPVATVAAMTAEPEPAEAGDAPAAEPEPAATPAEAAPVAPAAADDQALLSDIIVTSGSEEIDLADPDVRDLLTQLVDDEIELAKACHAQGQILDAILQLTEAEKASAALGLDDRLATVKALLAELQA
jgi:2-oxoglutarate dehydrogenase E2 component (dihydrolipoamide succinyltransferase)